MNTKSKNNKYKLILRRALAYLLDILILFIILAAAGLLIQLAIGSFPETGKEIWLTLIWNFSIPVWLYFTISDSSKGGATLAKRLLNLRVIRTDEAQITLGNALLRTAIKLIPWELVHISAFALSVDLNDITTVQLVGYMVANTLIGIYFILFLVTGGERSVHDFAARTQVVMTDGVDI